MQWLGRAKQEVSKPSPAVTVTTPTPAGRDVFNSLPVELLDNIFELVHPPSSLYHVALVCRRWRECAQRALFQDVRLRTNETALYWLVSPLRKTIQPKNLVVTYQVPLYEVLPECDRLQSLTVNLFCRDVKTVFRFLALPSLSGLKSLAILSPGSQPLLVQPGVQPQFHLSHLQLDAKSSLTFDFLNFIFECSLSSLSSLHLSNYAESVAITHSLPRLGARLQHLTISGESSASYTSLLPCFASLLSLSLQLPYEILHESILPLPPSVTQLHRRRRTAAHPALLSSLPPTLQHLSIYSTKSFPSALSDLLQPLAELVPRGNTNLTRLSLRTIRGDELVGTPAGTTLVQACKDRGVVILARDGAFLEEGFVAC